MSTPWHTSAAIVVAGGSIALALYFALRPPAPPTPLPSTTGATAPRSTADDPIAARDHQRRIDELAAPVDPSNAAPPSAPVAAGTPATTVPADPLVAAPSLAAGLPGVAAPPELVAAATEQASLRFEERRSQLVATCWDDAIEGPDSIPLTLSLSYDANGRVLASGVTEDRERHRPEVATCIGPLIHDLSIPPPGGLVAISLRVTLP